MSLEDLARSPNFEPKPTFASRKAKREAIDPDKPLSKRERVFVAEYMVDLDGSAALRRMGRTRNPDKRANEILQRANVKKAVEAAITKREKAAEVNIERIVKRYSEFAFEYAHSGPVLPGHVLSALDALAKFKGMFKPETQTVIPVTFQFLSGPPLPIDGQGNPQEPITIQATPKALGVDKPEPK